MRPASLCSMLSSSPTRRTHSTPPADRFPRLSLSHAPKPRIPASARLWGSPRTPPSVPTWLCSLCRAATSRRPLPTRGKACSTLIPTFSPQPTKPRRHRRRWRGPARWLRLTRVLRTPSTAPDGRRPHGAVWDAARAHPSAPPATASTYWMTPAPEAASAFGAGMPAAWSCSPDTLPGTTRVLTSRHASASASCTSSLTPLSPSADPYASGAADA